MKTTLPVLLVAPAVIAGLATATENPTVSNTPTTNLALNVTKIGGHELATCNSKGDWNLWSWYYNTRSNGPHFCAKFNSDRYWNMLRAYRSGGTEGVHWKYTNDEKDQECLWDWKYYSSDGQTLITTVSGRTTTLNDNRRWCPLAVYRQGGVEWKQWEYCNCDHYVGG